MGRTKKRSRGVCLTTLGPVPTSEIKILLELVGRHKLDDVTVEFVRVSDPARDDESVGGFAKWPPRYIRIYAGVKAPLPAIRRVLLHEFAHLLTYRAKRETITFKGKHRRPVRPSPHDETFRPHGTYFYQTLFGLYDEYLVPYFPEYGPVAVAAEMAYRPRAARRYAFEFAVRNNIGYRGVSAAMNCVVEGWSASRRPQKRIGRIADRFIVDLAKLEPIQRAACEVSP